MKTINFIFLSLLAVALLSACARHDFIDDISITGAIGPQAYWSVESSMVSAGSDMSFAVQYYTTNKEVSIDKSEVWYNITETIEKKVSCPWVTTDNAFSISSNETEEKRVSQKIKEYSHSLAVWTDSIHAYTFEDKFPVSNTLSTFPWPAGPNEFDSTKMKAYFGENYMEFFKDSLKIRMKHADYKKMMTEMPIVGNPEKPFLVDFKQYTDSVFNVNTDKWEYVFHKDANGIRSVPVEISAKFDSIPFDRLIKGASGYEVEYKRTYSMKAVLRVYDTRGVYGTTETKEISIN